MDNLIPFIINAILGWGLTIAPIILLLLILIEVRRIGRKINS